MPDRQKQVEMMSDPAWLYRFFADERERIRYYQARVFFFFFLLKAYRFNATMF